MDEPGNVKVVKKSTAARASADPSVAKRIRIPREGRFWRACGRPTNTEQGASPSTHSLTLPSKNPVTVDRPRDPTTTRSIPFSLMAFKISSPALPSTTS